MPTGALAAAAAYILWGLFPLYIKQLPGVPAFELVLHRAVWSLVFVMIVLAALRRFAWLPAALRQPRLLLVTTFSALLLSSNWLIYVWAVGAGRIVDASLGYFINPLVSVLLGYAVLHERPRALQWLAVAVAAAGVLWLTLAAGELPWIALVLACSFGTYGLLRKRTPLGALEGLALETLVLAPLMLPLLLWFSVQPGSALAGGSVPTLLWLLAAGPVTAVPLLLFAIGARRVTLATLGVLQYVSPSLQFLLGVFVYGEPFDSTRLVGFGFIWTALLLYSAEGLWQWRRAPLPPALSPLPEPVPVPVPVSGSDDRRPTAPPSRPHPPR